MPPIGDPRSGGASIAVSAASREHLHRDALVAAEDVDAVGPGVRMAAELAGSIASASVEEHREGGGAPGVGGADHGVADRVDLRGPLLGEREVSARSSGASP